MTTHPDNDRRDNSLTYQLLDEIHDIKEAVNMLTYQVGLIMAAAKWLLMTILGAIVIAILRVILIK